MKKSEELKKKLTYRRKFFWQDFKEEADQAMAFCEPYKKFLDTCKTERECVEHYRSVIEEKGFVAVEEAGDAKKRYRFSRNKNAAFAIIGKAPISEGVNLIVSHIDAPRVDLKQNPLYEDSATKLGMMRTHYYGGVKKYQWFSTPLAIHGTFIKADGTAVNLSIGEDENDPVFVMPDLLPHLSRKVQGSKNIGEALNAGQMNVVFASMPWLEEDEDISEAVKLNALALLNDKYGIVEEDFLSAELQLVPAGKARDVGMDKSLVLGYGQDDRVCAFTSSEALFALTDQPQRTAIVYLADKEEIGSEGNTGAKSIFIQDFISDLLLANGEKGDSATLRKTLINSQILSADVNAGINPNFPSVHEADNAVHLGFGVSVTKYTGSGGKGGSNDANAEFNARIIKLYNEGGVNWQTGALGKVDEGGGGTIAKFMAEHGAEVIDCGTGVLGMHALYELTSKADVYSTYKAYKVFFEKA